MVSGAQNTRGGKFCDFRLKSPFISETVRNRPMVAMIVPVCIGELQINIYLSLSVLTAIFPGEPGLAGYTGAKDDGSDGVNWSYKSR